MKLITLFLAIWAVVFFYGCSDDENATTKISYVDVALGGCNLSTKSTLKEGLENTDTVYTYIANDSIHVFVGVHYTCCTTFESGVQMGDGNIDIVVEDVCDGSTDCYCKCMCYYTWDFAFINPDDEAFNYNVTLISPIHGTSTLKKSE